MTGDDFVGLARLNFFVSRWACAPFVSEFHFRGLLMGFRSFVLERHGGEFFVELKPLIVLFHVGLGFCFVSRRTCAAFCWSGAFGVLR